eukprot:GEMP01022737.1.p1 GENE.GEMP01022737.1~~GEMP01022737.1.p1  ORF type:complete len:448 (+),score=72.65 GEMP01022737.1:172-1515(+)
MKSPKVDPLLRWKVLICTCLGLFGQFYCYDIPSALADNLKAHFRDTLTADEFAYYFNLLYTIYSMPNIVLPLVFGFFMDRTGIRLSIILLSTFVLCGALLVAFGMHMESFGWMLFGRFVLGFGGESLQVAQAALLYQMFRGEEVALALGANLSIARAGSVLNDVLSPYLGDRFGLLTAMWFGAFMVSLSFCANILSVSFDKTESPAQHGTEESSSLIPSFHFSKQFWILAVYTTCIYSAILPFNNIAVEFFVDVRGESHQAAGNALAVLFLISAIFAPFFGYFVDNVGHRTHFLVGSAVVLMTSHSLLFRLAPAVVCGMIGLVYMVFAAVVWPTVGLTVPAKQLGSAYGVTTSMQNFGLCLVPIFVATLQGSTTDVTKGYEHAASLFMILGFFGVLSSYMLHKDPEAALLNMSSFGENPEIIRISARDSKKPQEYTHILGRHSKDYL